MELCNAAYSRVCGFISTIIRLRIVPRFGLVWFARIPLVVVVRLIPSSSGRQGRKAERGRVLR